MKLKKVLVVYKKSAFTLYQKQIEKSLVSNPAKILSRKISDIMNAHQQHYETLGQVEKVLRSSHIPYSKRLRKKPVDFNKYSLIITVGGDGTFLEASRYVKNHLILGINSAPCHSVGKLCVGDKNNFEDYLKRIIKDDFEIESLHRLRLRFNKNRAFVDALNEILICDSNPAIMSRYYLAVNDQSEAQYGSGIWISTPVGSTAAIKSAGGKVIKMTEKKMQYLPRELYQRNKKKYILKGGVLNKNARINITSFMNKGMIYIDGNHTSFPLHYGEKITISFSPISVKTLKFT